MEHRLEREVRFLKLYALAATLSCGVFFLSAFAFENKSQKFVEIDVERINIVERDGRLRMVISNQERQHPGIVNGKIIKRDGPRPPGMIFFNHLGDEMGGLIFGDNGGSGHFGSLTWDKVRGDQTIGFRHLEGDDGKYQVGLEMWRQPDLPGDVLNAKVEALQKIADEKERRAAVQAARDRGELPSNMLFLGKYRDDTNLLLMYDTRGRPRIRMQVAPDGTPRLEFLDEAGKVLHSLPDAAAAPKPPAPRP